MTITYPELETKDTLSEVWRKVIGDREIVRVKRDGDNEEVALIAADELDSILETMHVLRSPANAKRLFAALHRAQKNTVPPQTVDALRDELGLSGDGT